MPKNTGRGSRSAAASANQNGHISNMWTARNASTGRFVQAKTNGGTFKPVVDRKPAPPRKQA